MTTTITLELPMGHPALDNFNTDWSGICNGETPRVFLTVGAEGKEDVIIAMSGVVKVNYDSNSNGIAMATIELIAY